MNSSTNTSAPSELAALRAGPNSVKTRFSVAAGVLCVIAAIMIPSCCVGVPQALALVGLSPGLRCLLILERLRPLFVSVSVATLAYQLWTIFSSPALRSRTVVGMLAASVISNVVMLGLLVFVEIRYQ